MENKKYLGVLIALIISGCATVNHEAPPSAGNVLDFFDAKQGNELYVVYKKNSVGTPTDIYNVYESAGEAISLFQNNKSFITRYDCIRILPKTAQKSTTVCDQGMWFGYGKDDTTILTTRKAKDPITATVGGVFAVALTPLSLAVDVLSMDPKLSSTRNNLTQSVSDPVQNYEELASVRNIASIIFSNMLHREHSAASQDLQQAVAFSKNYPRLSTTYIVDSLLNRGMRNRSPKQVADVLRQMQTTQQQYGTAINFMRGLNTFDGYSTAFGFTKAVEDGKAAKQLASGNGDNTQLEHLMLQYTLTQRPLKDLFIVMPEVLESREGSERNNQGAFLSFKEMVKEGTMNYSAPVIVRQNQLDLKYGEYDVTLKATLSLPVNYYRRSDWIGNVDLNETRTQTRQQTVRLRPSSYENRVRFNFESVLVSYKDRGTAGGTTEIKLVGTPRIDVEVIDVSPVN